MSSMTPALSIVRVVVAGPLALRTSVQTDPGVRVVAEAEELRAFIGAVQRQQPTVAVVDAGMLGEAGLAELARVRMAGGGVRILMISDDDPAMVRRAFLMGAAGFLARGASAEDISSAIRALARGRSFVMVDDPAAMNEVLRSPASSPAAAVSSLSHRERQVLSYIARGHTNKQAAEMIGLSVKTVESYRARIMQKLQLRGRADLTSLAVESGMFEGGGTAPQQPPAAQNNQTPGAARLRWEIA